MTTICRGIASPTFNCEQITTSPPIKPFCNEHRRRYRLLKCPTSTSKAMSPGRRPRPSVGSLHQWRKSDADQPVSALPTFSIHLSSTGMVNLPDPKKTVLLVCDVQERFRTFHAADPADSRRRYLELRCGRLDYAQDGQGCESGFLFAFTVRNLFSPLATSQ